MQSIIKSVQETDNRQAVMYYPELDGLRFLAFLLVFIHHTDLFLYVPYLEFLHTFGWIGVDLFFVLSAFLFTRLLLTEHHASSRINFKKFYLRRIFRIWPIYYAFIFFAFLLYSVPHFSTLSAETGSRMLGLCIFSDNIFSAISGYNPINYVAHLWTISYEEQFYIFIPVIIALLANTSNRTRIALLAGTFVIFSLARVLMIMNLADTISIWVLPITHFESIMFGMVIGFGGLDFLTKRFHSLSIFIASLFIFYLLSLVPHHKIATYWTFGTYILTGICTALMLLATLANSQLKNMLSQNFLVYFGKRSYGLYVYHAFGIGIASYLAKYIDSESPATLAAITFIISLLFTLTTSILSYRLIERPFLELKKKYEIIRSRPI